MTADASDDELTPLLDIRVPLTLLCNSNWTPYCLGLFEKIPDAGIGSGERCEKKKILNLCKRFFFETLMSREEKGGKGARGAWRCGCPTLREFVYRERKVGFKISGGEVLASGHKRQLMPFFSLSSLRLGSQDSSSRYSRVRKRQSCLCCIGA